MIQSGCWVGEHFQVVSAQVERKEGLLCGFLLVCASFGLLYALCCCAPALHTMASQLHESVALSTRVTGVHDVGSSIGCWVFCHWRGTHVVAIEDSNTADE